FNFRGPTYKKKQRHSWQRYFFIKKSAVWLNVQIADPLVNHVDLTGVFLEISRRARPGLLCLIKFLA
ncbi:hypothetical protein, partial [Enterobacter intestinihominis]